MVLGSTFINWNNVIEATSGPLWYSVTLLAIVVLFGREIWAATRGTRPVALSLATAVLTIAAFGIVGVRYIALAR